MCIHRKSKNANAAKNGMFLKLNKCKITEPVSFMHPTNDDNGAKYQFSKVKYDL